MERLGPVSRSLEDTRQAAPRGWTLWETWIQLHMFPQFSHLLSPLSVSKSPIILAAPALWLGGVGSGLAEEAGTPGQSLLSVTG